MEFKDAYELMKKGYSVKRKNWSGYWYLKNDTVIIKLKDGNELDNNTNDLKFTIENILSDDWELIEPENLNSIRADITETNDGSGTSVKMAKLYKKGYKPINLKIMADGSIYYNVTDDINYNDRKDRYIILAKEFYNKIKEKDNE